jgi:flavin-dependent dehydrogenase
LIGDVAGQVKPTTGGGIYYAMRSSDIASEVVINCLKNEKFSAKYLSLYSKNWEQLFKNELRIGLLINYAMSCL